MTIRVQEFGSQNHVRLSVRRRKLCATLVTNPHEDYYHASCLYSGLDFLARRNLISFNSRTEESCKGIRLELSDAENAAHKVIAVDLHDSSRMLRHRDLEQCDIYFKRSFYPSDIASLSPDLAAKVVPLGLNFACRSRGSTVRLLRQIAVRSVLSGARGLRILHGHMTLPRAIDFQQGPTVALQTSIVFQTRVWEQEDAPPAEAEIINAQRVAIIRALKVAFGDKFIGGLVPTPLAQRCYSSEITNYSTLRRNYTAMSKRHLIGVYTRGLHNSIAFKFAEYLAGAQCIVAEPPRNTLPAPLVPGKHYLPFDNPEQCVQACQTLLSDANLAQSMRIANHDYYASEVAPAVTAARVCGIDRPDSHPSSKLPN